jgi:class 3 adenylate cyclase
LFSLFFFCLLISSIFVFFFFNDTATTEIYTTLGDAANVAARLESMCKDSSCEAMISHDVWRIAGLPPEALEGRDVSLRGRSASLRVHPIDRVEQLADLIRLPVQAGG